MSFLFDTSSLLLLIRSSNEDKKLNALKQSKVLDLTYFELGNAIWKESELLQSLTEDQRDTLVRAIVKTLTTIESVTLYADDFTDIFDIARSERLTFYDSSYIYAAKANKMILVSDDGRLSRIARKYTKAQSVHSLL